MTTIIGIDPGRTTGFVRLYATEAGLVVQQAHEIPWNDRFSLLDILAFCGSLSPLHVVVESFRLYEDKARDQIGNDFPSVQVIGIVEAGLYRAGILSCLHYQSASLKMRVKIVHENELPASPHVRDAYQHARYFYVVGLRGHDENTLRVPASSH